MGVLSIRDKENRFYIFWPKVVLEFRKGYVLSSESEGKY